eukprot:CAMPEP_0175874732 /NCGR_PEP_ID=MMETSP0107_2-20121207/39056_1 /TAXON_ID=195067 ORGANISM="Goniomonas pacifica, Strain CCMP1869" /NCGR_SAMPLE_ID=MMETSP0107_2 /ASSEMBLY_ACC=CAM_ASM_000203 /LENGTH=69 /DNA_ID=CAMNT_0017193659 /DNA_START=1 /DNA_END=206 /DNA_ORIENTATION=+
MTYTQLYSQYEMMLRMPLPGLQSQRDAVVSTLMTLAAKIKALNSKALELQTAPLPTSAMSAVPLAGASV